jgi:hypothetical protein
VCVCVGGGGVGEWAGVCVRVRARERVSVRVAQAHRTECAAAVLVEAIRTPLRVATDALRVLDTVVQMIPPLLLIRLEFVCGDGYALSGQVLVEHVQDELNCARVHSEFNRACVELDCHVDRSVHLEVLRT